MFIFDIETLGVESNAVILSAALIYFDPEKQPSYQDLLNKISFDPSSEDVTAEDAMTILHNYMNRYPDANKHTMWARGSLDQMAIDSLARKVDSQPITGYNMWRDVRTAIDCLTGSTNGYCDVDHPTFKRHEVIKHHPVHDCALDAMMLMYGKN